jgi:hypothetical protein
MSESTSDERLCFLCTSHTASIGHSEATGAWMVRCFDCGTYGITDNALNELRIAPGRAARRAALSVACRAAERSGSHLMITPALLNTV